MSGALEQVVTAKLTRWRWVGAEDIKLQERSVLLGRFAEILDRISAEPVLEGIARQFGVDLHGSSFAIWCLGF